MSEGTLFTIRLQVALHSFVKVKSLANCTLNWKRFLQVALCLLFGKGRSSRTGCVVLGCDDRRTRSIGRLQVK